MLTLVVPINRILDRVQMPQRKGLFWGKVRPAPLKSTGSLCIGVGKNGLTDRYAVWG